MENDLNRKKPHKLIIGVVIGFVVGAVLGVITLNFILFSGGIDTSWAIKDNSSIGKQIVQLDFPKTALIVMIQRNGKFITPNGSTVLEPLDKLYVLSEDNEGLKQVYNCLNLVT